MNRLLWIAVIFCIACAILGYHYAPLPGTVTYTPPDELMWLNGQQ